MAGTVNCQECGKHIRDLPGILRVHKVWNELCDGCKQKESDMAAKQESVKAQAIAKKQVFAAKVRKLRAQVASKEITSGEAMTARQALLNAG